LHSLVNNNNWKREPLIKDITNSLTMKYRTHIPILMLTLINVIMVLRVLKTKISIIVGVDHMILSLILVDCSLL